MMQHVQMDQRPFQVRHAYERWQTMTSRAARPFESADMAASELHQPVDGVLWYVTMVPAGSKIGRNPQFCAFLLGPYQSHVEAEANVSLGRRLASDYNPKHWFDAVGVSSLPEDTCPGKIHFSETNGVTNP